MLEPAGEVIAGTRVVVAVADEAGPAQIAEIAGRAPADQRRDQPERDGPEHGQHTEEILLGMGMDWEKLAALKEDGSIL